MDSFGLLPKMPGLVILETPSRSESWYSLEVLRLLPAKGDRRSSEGRVDVGIIQ